jgi:carboxymethylenebutenolidase
MSVASETVQFTSDQATIRAFLARPSDASAAVPGALILHEWWGLTDHIRDVARRFAQEGVAALAPDLYARLGSKVAASPQEAAALMSALSAQAVLRDLNAAIRCLATQPVVDPLRLGVVGFSMGGTFALTQATHNSDLKAAVVFYGKVPPPESFRYLLCPVQYHYAAKDVWVTRREIEQMVQGLARYGKPGTVQVYPEADHAFFNDTRPEVYRAQDARLAWDRTLMFLRQHL